MGCISNRHIVSPVNSEKNPLPSPSPIVTRVEDLKINSGAFVQLLHKPFSECYHMLRELGSGQFGKVYLAESDLTGERRAVKVISKKKSDSLRGKSKFIAEVEILARLNHINIIRIYEMFEDDKRYYVVSELCTGGELFDFITQQGHLSEALAAEIMRQLLSAVCYCHEHHIVHRDLKPENLLLDSPPVEGQSLTIKLIDFGTSCLYTEDRLSQRMGTAYYIAPEVLEMNYNEKCDVWSCGVIMFILLSGFPPFSGGSDEEILSKVKLGKFSFAHDCWRNISNEAKSLIRRMLVMNPQQRLTAADCLSDPWIIKRAIYHSAPSQQVLLSLNQLKNFRAEQKLREAFLTFMTSRLMTKEYEKELTEAFRALDTNGDGKLSREELLEGYKQHMPLEEAEQAVNTVLARVDADHSGFIDYSEFVVASADYQLLLSQNNLEAAFSMFDKDGSGKISSAELKAMLDAQAEVSEEVWTALVKQADQDGDGEIEFKEFCRLMQTVEGVLTA